MVSNRRKKEIKCDKLWSDIICRIWNGRCAACWILDRRINNSVSPHHIIGRSRKSVRHEVYNGIALCHRHHRWAHEHPRAFLNFLKANFITHFMFRKEHLHDKPKRISQIDFEDRIKFLTSLSKELEHQRYI